MKPFAAAFAATLYLAMGCAGFAQSNTSVLTYHNNAMRWGWNSQETILSPSTFTTKPSKFGVAATVSNLDGPIYAQPLVAPQVNVRCAPSQTAVVCAAGTLGVRNVVFVATTNNTLYAIDADSGAILLKRNFGTFGHCGGITSTPVIDPATGVLYLVTQGNLKGVYSVSLFALDMGSLMNAKTPYSITSADTSNPLTGGQTYGFDPSTSCQRPGLLLSAGNIYAGFTGYEYAAGTPPTPQSGSSRGWVLGWSASTLAPIAPLLTNQETASTNGFFLTSIWMSGAGIASDGSNLFFITGNSDPSGTSYDPVKNIEESVVKATADLKVASVFTPYNYANLDLNDYDFGSGGAMLLPGTPSLVVAAGKDGRMFLLNGDNLGGYTPGGPDKVLDMHNIGGCWCAPSFYINHSGPHVVSSGGNSVGAWRLFTSASTAPTLVQDGYGVLPASNQDPGFFTSVSSKGADAAIIWALGRPVDSSNTITLYAFDGASNAGVLPLLGSYPAGVWSVGGNMSSVPVVANGKVYVVSGGSSPPSGTLTIFGILP